MYICICIYIYTCQAWKRWKCHRRSDTCVANAHQPLQKKAADFRGAHRDGASQRARLPAPHIYQYEDTYSSMRTHT